MLPSQLPSHTFWLRMQVPSMYRRLLNPDETESIYCSGVYSIDPKYTRFHDRLVATRYADGLWRNNPSHNYADSCGEWPFSTEQEAAIYNEVPACVEDVHWENVHRASGDELTWAMGELFQAGIPFLIGGLGPAGTVLLAPTPRSMEAKRILERVDPTDVVGDNYQLRLQLLLDRMDRASIAAAEQKKVSTERLPPIEALRPEPDAPMGVYTEITREGVTVWAKIGIARKTPAGHIRVVLHALPLDGTMTIRVGRED